MPPSYRLSQPSRPPRPLSATQSTVAHSWGNQHNQAERKLSDGHLQVFESSSSSCRLPPRSPPARPPPPAVRRSQSQQAKPKPGQTQNTSPLPKPQPSFLYTHTHMQPQRVLSPGQSQPVPLQEGFGQEDEKTAFGITFSKLYNLKGLKDKMSKLPTQSRRSSSGSSAQARKSTG